MQNRRKWLPLLLTAVMTLSMLVGCSKNSADKNAVAATTASQQTKGQTSEPVKVSILVNASGLPDADKDVIRAEFLKRLNIDLNMTSITSDYQNQLNVRLASGNAPDIFQLDANTLRGLDGKGMLLDLTPYLSKELKPVNDWLGPDTLKTVLINGKYMAFPNQPQFAYNSYWIRQDWLDKLGMKVPTTLDEFAAVVKAFRENDPDGNGKKDTYGLSGIGMDTFAPIFGAYDVAVPNNFYVKNGKVMNSYYDPDVKPALQYITQLVGSGAVDPDIFSLKSTAELQQKAYQGQVGLIRIGWSDFAKDDQLAEIKKANPNAKWIQILPPQGPGGQFDGIQASAPRYYGVSAAVAKDPKKLQKIFDLFNYLTTPDGINLVEYGVQGVHYNSANGKIELTNKIADIGYVWIYQLLGRNNELDYLNVKFPNQAQVTKFASSDPRIQSYNALIDPPEGFNLADAQKFADEELVKFIYNKEPLSNYDAFLKTLNDTYNFKAYMNNAQKNLSAVGLAK